MLLSYSYFYLFDAKVRIITTIFMCFCMEMVSGLFLSKDIVYQNGKPAYLVDLSKAFEWLFNIRIGDCHQKHEDVIKRKPGKITEFLNGLAELIKKEHDKKGYR